MGLLLEDFKLAMLSVVDGSVDHVVVCKDVDVLGGTVLDLESA